MSNRKVLPRNVNSASKTLASGSASKTQTGASASKRVTTGSASKTFRSGSATKTTNGSASKFGSTSKTVTSNTKARHMLGGPLTQKFDLNATSRTNISAMPHIKDSLNFTTMLSNMGSYVEPVLQTDWDLQCDMVYNDYLQAVMIKEIVQNVVKQKEISLDDQLSLRNEKLMGQKTQKRVIGADITNVQTQFELEMTFSSLNAMITKMKDIFEEYQMEKSLQGLNKYFEYVANRLNLSNIKEFETQEEYDEFTKQIETSTEIMKNMKAVVGDIEGTQKLVDALDQMQRLHNEVVAKEKSLSKFHEELTYNTLKTIADKLEILKE